MLRMDTKVMIDYQFDISCAGFLPEQIWVRLPDPTDLPLSDLKILGKNLPIWGGKNC